MGKIIDFKEAQAVYTFNTLEGWRKSFAEELKAKGYTTAISATLFPNDPVDQSKDLFELNTKIMNLPVGKKLILFRNHHFDLFFYLSYEKNLTLRIGSLANGIDAFLLENKFNEEKKIFNKYFSLMLDIFGK
ncbi:MULTISPECIES: hypothetical protein [Enterococcus]|uniref:Uncharacterized protein n=1 Tax=Enterococcus dongliensis TaxID=2559925 RepID=A0ABU3ETR8_9ENTE|nr:MULTISPECIES: hypothetical protein [Enterococcus]MDT2597361.1 hypothetical protein [Enterococcus dongliensis]